MNPSPDQNPIRVDASLESLGVLRRYLRERLPHLGFGESILSGVLTSVDEAATNIVIHGYQENDLSGSIEMAVERDSDALVITLTDQAPHFDPTRIHQPDVNAPLESRSPGGLGVFLIREFMDEITYKALPKGNRLILRKTDAGE